MIDTDDLDNMSRLGFIPKRGLVELLEAYNESLAEVKRLRERLIRAYDWAENAVNGNDSAMMDYTEYVCGGEEE